MGKSRVRNINTGGGNYIEKNEGGYAEGNLFAKVGGLEDLSALVNKRLGPAQSEEKSSTDMQAEVVGEIMTVNRPGSAGGSNSQIGWSHDKSHDKQVLSRSSRPGGADGARARERASVALGSDGVDCNEVWLLTAHVA